MSTCIISIGSVTQAMKAKRILADHSIPVNTVKISSKSKNGCIHGIEFGCQNLSNVKHILTSSGVSFEEWYL